MLEIILGFSLLVGVPFFSFFSIRNRIRLKEIEREMRFIRDQVCEMRGRSARFNSDYTLAD